MMEEMMRECCGPEGKPDFEKMKKFIEKCGCRLPDLSNCLFRCENANAGGSRCLLSGSVLPSSW